MLKFPDTTLVNKVVPKNAFYKHLEVDNKMKRIFVNDVDRIIWANKLAPTTLNVSDGKSVHEITVFSIQIKSIETPTDMLVFLDKNIPRHTLFIVSYEDKSSIIINYKEATTNNSAQPYKVTNTYQTEWLKTEDLELRVEGSSMDSLYDSLVRQIAGSGIVEESGNLKQDIANSEQREKLLKEINALKNRLATEKQPSKKFVLHKKIKELENKL